jgi:hypothetical protein
MPYCPECGTELPSEASFCSECGTSVSFGSGVPDPSATSEGGGGGRTQTQTDEDLDTDRAVISVVMGVIVGAIVAFAFTNVGGALIFFIITIGGVAYYLYQTQETNRLAAGMGLYITALWMPLAPIIFYIPLAGGANTDTARGTGEAIGSVLGMFIYGFIGLILGIVIAAVGYFLRKGERE